MGITSYDNDDTIIKGLDANGDSQPITVIANPGGGYGISPVAAAKPIHFQKCLTNGGSDDMAVNGSVTAVDFTLAPPAGEVWHLDNIGITLQDSGSNDADKFGAINNGLTNGLGIIQHISSTEYTYVTVKTNIHLANVFTVSSHFMGVGSGFINDANLFTGSISIKPEIVLIGDNGDKLIARVSDNLSPLNTLNMRVCGWRDLG